MGTPIFKEDNILRSSNVATFQEHPCAQEPCHNGGQCNPKLDTYECVCLSGFSGGHCQSSESPFSLFFPLFFSEIFIQGVFFMIHSNLLLLNSHRGGGKLQSFWLHKMFRFLINWLDSGSISWLRLKLRMSGTESCNILCNAACSWLASREELQLLFTV